MAKIYALTSVSINGGYHYNWTSAYWTGVGSLSSGYCKAYGKTGSACGWTNVLFDPDALAALSGKTVTSVLLQFTCETEPPSNSNVSCCLKANGSANLTGSGNSWQRLTAFTPLYNSTNVTTLSGTRRQMDMTAGGLPAYGYVFGPHEASNPSSYAVFDASNNPASEAATLVVTTDETDYTLSFDANGGTGAPPAQTGTGVGSYPFTLPSAAPARAGYTFLGWAAESTATAAAYQPGDTVAVTADTVLYAVWEAVTYAVCYDASGGTGAPSAQTKTYGVTLTLSLTVPARTGFAFLGWAASDTATEAAYQPGGAYAENAAATLYAVWKKTASIYYGAAAGEPVIGGVTGTAYLAVDGQLREGNGIW